ANGTDKVTLANWYTRTDGDYHIDRVEFADGTQWSEAQLHAWGEGTPPEGGGGSLNQILGTSGNDVLTGTNDNDLLDGGAGNDTLNGGNGSDVIFGNIGQDTILGGNGADQIFGGQGDDLIGGDDGDDFLTGDLGDDTRGGGQWPRSLPLGGRSGNGSHCRL
ncbi:MAG: hypothetical protein HC825_04930, partial [Oscillatoriales cyanobacterium RM1_1_9]|nr:hypothetical protein [Oscillatoriales cyanobacterium RM1_1_9]